jgi:hypothetical protein
MEPAEWWVTPIHGADCSTMHGLAHWCRLICLLVPCPSPLVAVQEG